MGLYKYCSDMLNTVVEIRRFTNTVKNLQTFVSVMLSAFMFHFYGQIALVK